MDIAAKVDFEFIGHRVVHGGELFKDVTEMTEENLSQLSRISSNNLRCPLQFNISILLLRFRSGSSTQPCPDQCYQTLQSKVAELCRTSKRIKRVYILDSLARDKPLCSTLGSTVRWPPMCSCTACPWPGTEITMLESLYPGPC